MERFRQRRKIAVIAVTLSRTVIVSLALIPFIGDPAKQLAAPYFHWMSPETSEAVTVLQFQHGEFLFGISFLLGGYVLHVLSRISEGPEISELSPIEGLRAAILFPFGRLRERRRRPRAQSAGNEP